MGRVGGWGRGGGGGRLLIATVEQLFGTEPFDLVLIEKVITIMFRLYCALPFTYLLHPARSPPAVIGIDMLAELSRCRKYGSALSSCLFQYHHKQTLTMTSQALTSCSDLAVLNETPL